MADDSRKIIEINLPVLRERTGSALRGAGDFAMSTARLPSAFTPLVRLLAREEDITRDELGRELDRLFQTLYEHPISSQTRSLTGYLRRYRLIPNEDSTENLIRFLVHQVTLRSPVEIPRELAVFQEDVDPMTAEEVRQAFMESHGRPPEELYFGFRVHEPLKSGSIGSVYLAKKPMHQNGMEVLVPVIVKVARHNLEREFQMGSLAIELMLVSSQYWAPHSKLLPFLEAMSEQIKEFTRGFEQELNFEAEAQVQNRFAERARDSRSWHVPEVYEVKGRILEMEFLHDAMAINEVLGAREGRDRRRLQRRIAENFLFTVLEHLVVHQEFHGDLHPGNIMCNPDGSLYLIDWGNVVDMRGKWVMIRDYLSAVFLGDTERLADCLIAMSTDPDGNALRRHEIIASLDDTLRKRGVTPLIDQPLRRLYEEGQSGLQQRLQAAAHLASNAYQLRLVLQSDYLHLSRSLMAMGGTYANLYRGLSPLTMARDFVVDVGRFPLRLFSRRLGRRRRAVSTLPSH